MVFFLYSTTIQSSASISFWLASHPTQILLSAVFMHMLSVHGGISLLQIQLVRSSPEARNINISLPFQPIRRTLFPCFSASSAKPKPNVPVFPETILQPSDSSVMLDQSAANDFHKIGKFSSWCFNFHFQNSFQGIKIRLKASICGIFVSVRSAFSEVLPWRTMNSQPQSQTLHQA